MKVSVALRTNGVSGQLFASESWTGTAPAGLVSVTKSAAA